MNVPEKPSLDGLEAKWGEWWEAAGTYRFDRTKSREQIFAIDTPPPTVSGSLHVGPRDELHAHRPHGSVQAHAGRRGLLPDGLGRQRPGHRASRAELLRGPLRPRRSPTTRRSTVDAGATRRRGARRGEPQQLHRALRRLTVEDEKAFEALFRRLGLSVDWPRTYTTIGERLAAGLAACVPALAARGSRLHGRGAHDVGRRLPTAVAQAEIEDREIATAPTTASPSTVEDGGGASRSRPRGPELIPACVALVVNPSDERFASLVGTTALTPAVPRAGAGRGARARRPREGHRRRHDLHVRRRDRRHLVARARACPPASSCAGRHARAGARSASRAGSRATRKPPTPPWRELAGRHAKQARAPDRRSCCAMRGHLVGEPEPVQHVVKFYEKGDRPLEVISSRQWFVHTLDAQGPAARPRRADRLASGVHGRALRVLGRGPEPGLGDQPPALLRRAVPRLVPARRRTATPRYDDPILADEATLPIDPQDDVPPGYEAPSSAASPAGSWATPTSWTRGRPRRSRPRSPAHWEDDPDLFDRLFPMDLRPQAHDIIRTWLFYTVLRADLSTTRCPGRTPRSAASCSTPTARRCRSPRATSSCRPRCSSSTRADAVRYWAGERAAGLRRRDRRATDEGGPPARDQDPQRLAVRALDGRRARRDHRAARPRDARARSRASSCEATAAFEAYEHAKALDVIETLLLGLHRRLPRAREATRLRRVTVPRAPARRSARSAPRCDVLLRAVRAVPAYVDRGGLVVVARRRRCTAQPGPPPRSLRRRRSTRASTRWPPTCSPRCARRRRSRRSR